MNRFRSVLLIASCLIVFTACAEQDHTTEHVAARALDSLDVANQQVNAQAAQTSNSNMKLTDNLIEQNKALLAQQSNTNAQLVALSQTTQIIFVLFLCLVVIGLPVSAFVFMRIAPQFPPARQSSFPTTQRVFVVRQGQSGAMIVHESEPMREESRL